MQDMRGRCLWTWGNRRHRVRERESWEKNVDQIWVKVAGNVPSGFCLATCSCRWYIIGWNEWSKGKLSVYGCLKLNYFSKCLGVALWIDIGLRFHTVLCKKSGWSKQRGAGVCLAHSDTADEMEECLLPDYIQCSTAISEQLTEFRTERSLVVTCI